MVTIPTSLKYAGCLLCFAFLVVSCRSSERKAGTSVRDSQASYVFTAAGLSEAYAVDPTAADEKYKDKVVYLTGAVDYVESDLMGGYTVNLYAGAERFDVICCKFPKDQADFLLKLTQGAYVRMKGRCAGKAPALTLLDCVLVDDKGSPLGG